MQYLIGEVLISTDHLDLITDKIYLLAKVIALQLLHSIVILALEGHILHFLCVLCEDEGKALPLQAWKRPFRLKELEVPKSSRQSAHEGGKVVSPAHLPPLPPGGVDGTRYMLRG
jgi:hypothetical protein